MCLLLMPDCWLDVSVRKVLRSAISTQVFFLGFPVSLKQMLRRFPSPSCHYMLLMYPSRCKFSSTASSSCICVKSNCHRVKTQLQLNKYYYYYYYYFANRSAFPFNVDYMSIETESAVKINFLSILFRIIALGVCCLDKCLMFYYLLISSLSPIRL